jgi:His-Xaa-Ser system protein HxsD
VTLESCITTNANGTQSVRFASSAYSLDAVKQAAYKFAKTCGVVLQCDEKYTEATISFFDDKISELERSKLVGAFCNEVIDQDLRESIAAKTESIRNLILAQAFSKTNLLNND